MKYLAALSGGLLFLFSATSFAQETPRFTFDLGAGFTTPLSTTGNSLDDGWALKGGAGVNLNSHVGIMLNAGFNSLGINSATVTNIGTRNGSVNVFSATLDPVIHVGAYRHVNLYVTGGGGLYRTYNSFTQSSQGFVTVSNPLFGFNPVAGIDQPIQSFSVNKPGIDAGMGLEFGSKWHGKFFAEARYNRIFGTNYVKTDYMPVTFGFRW